MKKVALLSITAGTFLALAMDGPPPIPSGPVGYESVSYSEETIDFSAPLPKAPSPSPVEQAAPATLSPLSAVNEGHKYLSLHLNLYSSNYNVRGMGVTNAYSEYGYSSADFTYVLPKNNLFGWGIYQEVNGTMGLIWGHGQELGDTPLLRAGYALGKEIFPNLHAKLGYDIQHGGLEGYMAKARGKCSHRIAQDLYLSLEFNDHQQGFFGGTTLGYGFQGLTGWYWDNHVGYRLCDVLQTSRFNADVELELGLAYSSGYWTGGADGVDAYRLRASLCPYTTNGRLGREGRFSITPWVQWSWAGNNEDKINRDFGGLVDDFQMSVGIDMGWSF